MLRLVGAVLLVGGSAGLGWSVRERLKANLEGLYQLRHIFSMLQNEIAYSSASLPEACLRISGRTKEPYRSAFRAIHEEMTGNRGESFTAVWERQMKGCLQGIVMDKEDRKVFLDFGGCIGYADGKMQAQAVEQYMHRLDLSVTRLEKDMADKCRIIMSLSVMGGLMAAVILV